MYICNTSTTHACTISLYIKKLVRVDYPKMQTETNYDPKIHVHNNDGTETYTYHYFCKSFVIPLYTSLQFEEEIFEGIDFVYHSLCIQGDSNSAGDITLNIKYIYLYFSAS